MVKLWKYCVLIAGLLSIPAAAYLGIRTYATLTQASANVNQDFVFRLTMTVLAMTVPFVLTLALALTQRRKGSLRWPSQVGMTLAVLSLCLTIVPIRGLMRRVQQTRSLAAQGVPAPLFEP
jgi:uncharacterized oligopeptide transporter (OPT) family protein